MISSCAVCRKRSEETLTPRFQNVGKSMASSAALGSTAVLRGGSGFIDVLSSPGTKRGAHFKQWQARTRFGLGT
jgi:hypothetical protein